MEILNYKEEMEELLINHNNLVKSEHQLNMEEFIDEIDSEGEEGVGDECLVNGCLKISHLETKSGYSEKIRWDI